MSEFQSSEDRVQYISQKLLPASLESLAKKHHNLTQVVQYLEGNYLSSTTDKHVIVEEANNYLMTALVSVSADIESAATNLDQLLALNSNSIDSLSNQVNLLHTRLRMSKDSVAKQNLLDSRIGLRPETGVAIKTLEEDIVLEDNLSYNKSSMAKRLAALDEVGVCLNKSSSYRPQATSNFGTERGSVVKPSSSSSANQLAVNIDAVDGNASGHVPSGAVGRTANTGKAGTARRSLLGSTPMTDAPQIAKPPSLL